MRFKTPEVERRYHSLNPQLKKILVDICERTLKTHEIDLCVTATCSTKEEDLELERMSDTHRTRRAADIRTSGIPEEIIAEIIAWATKKYGKYGAIVGATPSLIVNKPHGTGPHLHVQLARKFALPEIAQWPELKK